MILILQVKTYLRLNFVTSWNFEFYLVFGVLAGADLIGSRNIINTKTELRRLNRLNSSSIAEMLRHNSVVALIAEYWSRLIGVEHCL